MQANQAGNPDYEAYLIGTMLILEKYSGQTDYPEPLKRLQVPAKHHAVATNNLGLHHALNFYRSNKSDKKERNRHSNYTLAKSFNLAILWFCVTKE